MQQRDVKEMSPREQAFHAKVAEAKLKLIGFTEDELEVIDLMGADLFSGGRPDGYSPEYKLHWKDLPLDPVFTRGEYDYPSRLQFWVMAGRLLRIVGEWEVAKSNKPAPPAALNVLALDARRKML